MKIKVSTFCLPNDESAMNVQKVFDPELFTTNFKCELGIELVELPTLTMDTFNFLQSHLTQDQASLVRVAYAENIALLAETALHFLEIVQLNHSHTDNGENGASTSGQDASQYKVGDKTTKY